ncbi:hypothetical protein ACWDSD_12145 [Streptomyces spiralis]
MSTSCSDARTGCHAAALKAIDPEFPDPALLSHGPTVTLSGHSPSERRVGFVPARA